MARSIDLFIDAPVELPELADRLGQLTGSPLVASPRGDRYILSEGDTVAHLGSHPFLDDGELLLSRYPYVLSARVSSGQSVADSRELALLRHLAELIRQRTSMAALVVHDLQNRDKASAPSAPTGSPERAGAPDQ
jgi:hypothetical protein